MTRTIEIIRAEYRKVYDHVLACTCTRAKVTDPHADDCPRGMRREELRRLKNEMDAIHAVRKAELKTAQEKAEDERIKKCFERIPATEGRPWGGHELVPLSHEESKCKLCGGIFFEPDLD